MKKMFCAITLLLSIVMVGVGCQRTPTSPTAKQYDIIGKIVAVDRDRGTVTLDHEDISGLMQGMEMEFKVEKPELLEGLNAGDEVMGQLDVQSSDQVITSIHKR
ncbi:MAG: copper-binding protein [Planctomycetia bacterium]|nr:copper-binding protein [Planctomycetia bacterium]